MINSLKKVYRFFAKKTMTILCKISCKTASKLLYKNLLKKKLNLKNPETFNEKLMKLKLENYNYNEDVFKCSDKYCVREYAKKCGVSEENLPTLLKVFNNVNEINIGKLPQKFVLKCSHGYGFNIVCKDKNTFNVEEAKKNLLKWSKTKFGYASCETHYTHIKPTIFAEEFIEGEDGKFPNDYKLYCFNGIPKLVLVCSEREEKLKLNFFDLNWNELDNIGKKEFRNNNVPKKPKHLDKMIEIAQMVSKEFPFVRVDFYEHNDCVYMGEMTFTPACCAAKYYTDYGDLFLGSLLNVGDTGAK